MSDSPTTRHVFLSYVHEDSAEVDRIEEALKSAGISVWRDTASLWPGEDWKRKIREAITADALAFVACFSRRSEAKPRSYQREEVLLAVEEFRLRQPDKPWLFPVRLSDVAVPYHEIGPNRSLSDLQRSDIFGPNEESNLIRLIVAIQKIVRPDSDPDVLLDLDRSQPESFVKRTLLDPTRRIELEDYVMGRANAVVNACQDEALFATRFTDSESQHARMLFVVGQTRRYWDPLHSLLQALVIGCAQGEDRHNGLWKRAIERVGHAANTNISGDIELVQLRRFPIIPALYAAGMAALHRENFSALHAIAVGAQYRSEYGVVPLVSAANPYRPFGFNDLVPQLLVADVGGEEANETLIQDLQSRRRGSKYTPMSTYLHDALRPYLDETIPDDSDFTLTFDRLEVILALLSLDLKAKLKTKEVYVEGPAYGAFTWRYSHSDLSLVGQMFQEFVEAGSGGRFFTSGLLGADFERATEVWTDFLEDTRSVRRH